MWEETRLPNGPCEPSRLVALELPLRADFIDGVAIGEESACFLFAALFRSVSWIWLKSCSMAGSPAISGFQGASRMASSRRSRGRLLIYAEHFICKQMDNNFPLWLNKMSDTRSTIHAIPSHPSRPTAAFSCCIGPMEAS